jgi:anthranilate/para-aminobenzoate synthase component I
VRFRPDRSRARYLADVKECLRLIRRGETYEVCLTNQIHAAAKPPPLALHAALRTINPAPYGAFLRCDLAGRLDGADADGADADGCDADGCDADLAPTPVANFEFVDGSEPRRPKGPRSGARREADARGAETAFALSCSSPERFLRTRVDDEGVVWAESKPIKGTAARCVGDAAEDAARARALAASEKDRAENLMIVDLVRNDLGRVCATGTVAVPALMAIESYATVHQMVSTVRGALRPGASAIDAVRAAFPGGSMTGAPKVRTMEIIARLEGGARSVYAGALGFLSANGRADLNIVIRTAVVTPKGVCMGSGGAVVALSDPEAEYEEMLLKVRPLMRAIAATTPGCDGTYEVDAGGGD